MDPSVGVAEDEKLHEWLLGKDKVVVRAAAMAVGMEEVKRLAGIFIEKHKYLPAAKLTFAYCTGTFEPFEPRAEEHEEAALKLLREIGEETDEVHQVE